MAPGGAARRGGEERGGKRAEAPFIFLLKLIASNSQILPAESLPGKTRAARLAPHAASRPLLRAGPPAAPIYRPGDGQPPLPMTTAPAKGGLPLLRSRNTDPPPRGRNGPSERAGRHVPGLAGGRRKAASLRAPCWVPTRAGVTRPGSGRPVGAVRGSPGGTREPSG